MTRTPIEQLQLSVRATNVLHRMGIHYVEELLETPLEVIAQQRNIGAKTRDEIKSVIENANDIIEYATQADDTAINSDDSGKADATPIEQLQLSVRASNVLHRMGIHYVEELIKTPLEVIAQQQNIGTKTFDEIKSVIENASDIIEHAMQTGDNAINSDDPGEVSAAPMFTEEQLFEMSRHTIEELGLSVRPFHALYRDGYLTIDKVAQMSDSNFSQMKGIGKKSIDEIKRTVTTWIRNNILSSGDLLQYEVDLKTQEQLQRLVIAMNPVMHLHWMQLYDALAADGSIERIKNANLDDAVKQVLCLPKMRDKLRAFWKITIRDGIICEDELRIKLNKLALAFPQSLLIDEAFKTQIIMNYGNVILVSRNTFLDFFEKNYAQDDRAAQILQLRLEGETLQDIGDLFGLTRERVRQITVKLVKKLPLLFEDYFSEPYQYFYFPKSEFCMAFPDVTEEGYEYLSIRYQRGRISLTSESLSGYNGVWKNQLDNFLCEKELCDDKKSVTKTEMVMRVLISNADKPLSIDEFVEEYYRYIERRGYSKERLKINLRTVGNHLRNTKGVVFNQDNKVRFCDADSRLVWKVIDFNRYKNTVISSELVFRDYQDEMEELDIRDGYELFYIIKASLDALDEKQLDIRCRRVPIIVLGDASETAQAIRLLKEISPVLYYDYYRFYEERFGVKKESAQGNPAISGALSAYYVDGHYIIDVPSIDERDVQRVRNALNEKSLWFIEDVEELFDRVCQYTTHDAINAAAFRRIDYTLNSTYVYRSSYGTALNFFETMISSKDIIDLTTLDRRMASLGMFAAALDKKEKALEYIETAPKILMSAKKIQDVYGISVGEIRELQSQMSVFYGIPFFNGKSIWPKIEDWPIIQKLQGNDWMLTCIMRQQDAVASLAVAGGIILSLDSNSLNLNRICEWIVSTHSKMSINNLEHVFNETFGTRIPASKFAEKLKASGLWDKIVTDSMDVYIDSLVDAGLADINVDDLLQEEFF